MSNNLIDFSTITLSILIDFSTTTVLSILIDFSTTYSIFVNKTPKVLSGNEVNSDLNSV
jgi:hypothetical protein